VPGLGEVQIYRTHPVFWEKSQFSEPEKFWMPFRNIENSFSLNFVDWSYEKANWVEFLWRR
jgi:hypothetical protein